MGTAEAGKRGHERSGKGGHASGATAPGPAVTAAQQVGPCGGRAGIWGHAHHLPRTPKEARRFIAARKPEAVRVGSLLAVVVLAAVTLAGCSAIARPSIEVTVTAPQEGVMGPLQGARVLLSDDIHGGTTDSDGKVPMYGVPAGRYNATVTWGDQTLVRTVVVGNQTTMVEVMLDETAVPDVVVKVADVRNADQPSCPAPSGVMVTCPPPWPSTKQAAQGAIVLLSDNVHGGRTGPDGHFSFFHLSAGPYNVTVTWQGQEQTRPVVVPRGAPAAVLAEFAFNHG